jgi:hypothetical protein
MNIRAWIASFLPVCLLFAYCSSLIGGAGDETTNGMVMGSIINQTGAYASDVQVELYPVNYDPVKQDAVVRVDTTDDSGRYVFVRNNPGYYNVQAVHLYDRTRALVSGLPVAGQKVVVPVATLLKPGSIKVMLPASVDNANGYVYIPGTSVFADLTGASGFVMVDSVPAGTVPGIYYSTRGGAGYAVLRYDVLVPSGGTVVVANPLWKYSRRLYLNTTTTGAAVTGNVAGFPVLVRLTDSNFIFNQVQKDGADLRFTKPDNTFLPYEIERYDSAGRRAEIWVRVDTVYASDSAQSIVMYWGNPDAADSSNGAAVFDTSEGFQGVWHLSEAGNTTAFDATGNHYDGTPYNMSGASAVSGMIGTAQRFNGNSSYVTMLNSAAGKLNFPENGDYTVSAWINANALDGRYHGIVYKSNFQYGLQIRPENTWEFNSFVNGSGWEGSNSPASAGSWHFLAGVRHGTRQFLYVDGVCVDSIKAVAYSDSLRKSDVSLEIGQCPDGGLEPDRYFAGLIDEVRILSVASGAGWIKLCYMNQKGQNALVKW